MTGPLPFLRISRTALTAKSRTFGFEMHTCRVVRLPLLMAKNSVNSFGSIAPVTLSCVAFGAGIPCAFVKTSPPQRTRTCQSLSGICIQRDSNDGACIVS